MKNISICLAIFLSFGLNAQNTFTNQDREMLIRMDEGFKLIQKQQLIIEKQIDETNKAIEESRKETELKINETRNSLNSTILTVFGLLFTGYIALFGFIYWDRKTAVKAVEDDQKELKAKISLHERIFKEVYSGKKLTPELLQQYGI